MQRTPVTTLVGRKIARVITDPIHGSYYLLVDARGRVIVQVEKDSVFDHDGNYFEDDTP